MSRNARHLSSGLFFVTVLSAILTLRWAFYEPYVIPSGSMLPGLLIHDHIIVEKYAYGLRLPFSENWVFGPHLPRRGDVVVFKHPQRDYFMVKRVIGLPGDQIRIDEKGELFINDEKLESQPSTADAKGFYPVGEADIQADLDDYNFNQHDLEGIRFRTMLKKSRPYRVEQDYTVPEGHIFMMGDNRDNSSDSRFWGALDLKLVMGRAKSVWLSCEQTFTALPALCNPTTIRWPRFFHKLK